MRRRAPFIVNLVACLVIVVAGRAAAQPLADRVPADTLFYVGFSGTQNAPGYSGSKFEAVMKESNIGQVFRQVLPQAIRRIGREEPEAGKGLQLAYDLLAPMLKYPTAFYFAGVSFEGDEPTPRLGLVCRAGDDAPAIQAKLQSILEEVDGFAVPVRAIVSGQDVALLIGYADGEMALAGQDGAARPGPLAGAAGFKSALAKVEANPVVCLYVDFEQAVGLIESAVERFGDDEGKTLVPKSIEAFGLRGLKRVIVTDSFDSGEWLTRAFLEAPAPRTGLLAMLDGPNLSDDLLKAVPASADLFAAGSFDIGKLLTEIRTSLGKIDPELQKKFDQGLGAATMAVGRNFQTEVLDPLGSHWATYMAPEVAGGGLTGLVLINKLDDATKARGGMMALSIFAGNTAASLLAQQDDVDITVQGRQMKYGDLAINYIAAPVITPCWAVQGDYGILALYPQGAIGAARQMTGKAGPSILDNAGFQKLRARLGVSNARSMSYQNLPATAPEHYQGMLIISRFVGFADLFGISTPPVVIAPFHVFQENLTVAGGATWVDDTGLHGKNVSPFPFAGLFQASGGAAPQIIGMSAAQMSILLPSLNRARESANRVKSMNNLRQITMGAVMFANDNRGKLPENLGQILLTADLPIDLFLNPRKGTAAPQAMAMAQEVRADWVNENSDYVWLASGWDMNKLRSPAETIIAHENPQGLSDGVNVAFADGHVEFMLLREFRRRLADNPGPEGN